MVVSRTVVLVLVFGMLRASTTPQLVLVLRLILSLHFSDLFIDNSSIYFVGEQYLSYPKMQ